MRAQDYGVANDQSAQLKAQAQCQTIPTPTLSERFVKGGVDAIRAEIEKEVTAKFAEQIEYGNKAYKEVVDDLGMVQRGCSDLRAQLRLTKQSCQAEMLEHLKARILRADKENIELKSKLTYVIAQRDQANRDYIQVVSGSSFAEIQELKAKLADAECKLGAQDAKIAELKKQLAIWLGRV